MHPLFDLQDSSGLVLWAKFKLTLSWRIDFLSIAIKWPRLLHSPPNLTFMCTFFLHQGKAWWRGKCCLKENPHKCYSTDSHNFTNHVLSWNIIQDFKHNFDTVEWGGGVNILPVKILLFTIAYRDHLCMWFGGWTNRGIPINFPIYFGVLPSTWYVSLPKKIQFISHFRIFFGKCL